MWWENISAEDEILQLLSLGKILTVGNLTERTNYVTRTIRETLQRLIKQKKVKQLNTTPQMFALVDTDISGFGKQTKLEAMESLLKKMLPKFYELKIELDSELTEMEQKVVKEYE